MVITEETRVSQNHADWIRVKPLAPFGQAPYLEIKSADGKFVKLAQTMAIGNCPLNFVLFNKILLIASLIARYLARKFDMYGNDELEMAECGM